MKFSPLLNSRWLRALVWILGSFGALWALLWLAVPPMLQQQAQKIASAALGRQVTVGAVEFRPWSLELTLRDVAVASADGRADQLRVQRVYVDASLQSLLRLAPVVDTITLDQPVINLTRVAAGRYDIDDVLHKLSTPSAQPTPPSSEPLRFAFYNVTLNGGAINFTDEPVKASHHLSGLQLALPFLSNLPAQREVRTELRLAFDLNGSHFDSQVQTLPFTETRPTQAHFKLAGFNLQPYVGYIPDSVPVRLQAGVLDADIKLDFAQQQPIAAVSLSGTLQASKVRVADTHQQALLAFERLHIGLQDVRPLARSVRLSSLEWTGPVLNVHRARDGALNWALASAPAASASTPVAAVAAASAPAPAASAAAPVWDVALAQFALRGGRVDWQDDTVSRSTPARLSVGDITLTANALTLPRPNAEAQPAPFSGSMRLGGADLAAAEGALLSFSGAASTRQASVTATLSTLPLSLAAPYVAAFLEPRLSGTAHAAFGVNWQAPSASAANGALVLQLERFALEQLALTQGRTPLAALQRLELTATTADVTARTVTLGNLALTGPRIQLAREADGHWMYERWLKTPAAPQPTRTASNNASASTKPTAAPWNITLRDVSLSGGQVGWADASTPTPVALDVSALQLHLRNLVLGGKQPAALEVAGRLKAGQSEPGRFGYRGTLGLNPPQTQGQIELVRLPVHALVPYFGDALNVDLLRADTSFKGTLRYASTPAGPNVRVSGGAAIEDFRADMRAPSNPTSAPTTPAESTARLDLGSSELVSWRALSLQGVDVALSPGTRTTVSVGSTTLSDFFARVVLQPDGHLNLQNVVKRSAAPPEVAASAATPAASSATAVAAAPAASSAQASASAPLIRSGPISLLSGKVYFSDRFIKPNYSANLTELNGTLGAFSSVVEAGTASQAALTLRGRAEGSASLEIFGTLNPLAQPPALDIHGKVRDLELPPLSPYSVKYAGHGIERGKLSVDVGYKIDPDGQLRATNQLVLNQLDFGDAVEGAPASLPVKLAVALLADRHGVIDLNLPIEGSLNDPQFHLGPVIFKAIVNLIGKALLSPFSLLSSALGGAGEEMSQVSFAAGSATLTPDAMKKLDQVAKALADRPALKMTVVGEAQLEAERTGYQRERLNALVQEEKRREQVLGGAGASLVSRALSVVTTQPKVDLSAVSVPPAATATAVTTVVSDEEYPQFLKSLYQRADIPKPRNVVGLTKDVPVPEMEALLLSHIAVNEDRVRELATQRGVAVRDYLASRQLPLERLFLGAAKTPTPAEAAVLTVWHPHALLQLSAK